MERKIRDTLDALKELKEDLDWNDSLSILDFGSTGQEFLDLFEEFRNAHIPEKCVFVVDQEEIISGCIDAFCEIEDLENACCAVHSYIINHVNKRIGFPRVCSFEMTIPALTAATIAAVQDLIVETWGKDSIAKNNLNEYDVFTGPIAFEGHWSDCEETTFTNRHRLESAEASEDYVSSRSNRHAP